MVANGYVAEEAGFELSVSRDRDDGFRSNSQARLLPARDADPDLSRSATESDLPVPPKNFTDRYRRKAPKPW